MAPSKAERMEGEVGSRGEGEEEREVHGQGMNEGVLLGLTSSLAHLTLHQHQGKPEAGLEQHLASITLCDTPLKEETTKREEEEVEEEKENEKEAENTESEEEEEEKEADGGITKIGTEESKKIEEKIEKEEGNQKEEEEKEEREEVKSDADSRVKEAKNEATKIVKEEEEEKYEEELEREEEEEEEEEASDEENTSEAQTETKFQSQKHKLRSRGLFYGVGHGYAPSSHLDYQGLQHHQHHQQQQQQQQKHLQMHQNAMKSHYVGMSSPQYGQVAGYAGDSPTHSGSVGDNNDSSDLQQNLWGFGSPNSQQQQQQQQYYVGNNNNNSNTTSATSFYQSGSPQYYQESLPYAPFQQYQQHSPPYQSDNNLLHGVNSLRYQPDIGGDYQDSYLDGSCKVESRTPPLVHPTPITPPISPPMLPVMEGNQVEDILDAFTSVMKDDEPRMPLDESRIIEIKRTLMDIKQSRNLKEELNLQKYTEYYGACARHTDDQMMEADDDGDIKIMLAASQCQEQPWYGERLVAMTERVEKINLCCDRVVDRRLNICQECFNSDRDSFYSPLSWMNKYGQMVLSNVVTTCYSTAVVQYLTSKVMQRKTDLKRTFSKHYTLFFDNQQVYPCLTEPLEILMSLLREEE